MAQLTRMELQSKEDIRRIEINYKSKVEDLETRVQHLERAAQIPGLPTDQISSNEISQIVSKSRLGNLELANQRNFTKNVNLFEEQLVDVQQQYNINCDKHNEAKLRAAGLYRKSEAAHRAYGLSLQVSKPSH